MRGVVLFLSDETGAVTVEFTVLVPFFIFLLVFFADAAAIYATHTNMYDFARDAARRMSTGELENANEVVAYANGNLFFGQRQYTVFTDFGRNMNVLVEIPVSEAAIFGFFFRPIIGESLIARATMNQEPRLVQGQP